MLQPASDRLDYSKIIMSPDGYKLESAVGTTYSLDLAALLGIPIAFILGQSSDNKLCCPGIPLLEALRKASGRIAIFCQAGKVSVSTEQRELFALLEKSIAQVLPSKEYSFHPKVWIIKYVQTGHVHEVLFRVIVLSRNLTFDRSWDVTAVIDGKPSPSVHENGQQLSGFLEYLSKLHPEPGMRRMINKIAAEISKVDFKPDDKRFDDLSFYPMGYPGAEKKTPFDEKVHNATVISPFLSNSRIKALKSNLLGDQPMVLISRQEELDKLNPDTLKGIDCWHLKEAVVDGEHAIEEPGLTSSRQDIHAKMYLTTKYSRSRLWLGSANCSEKGFGGNIEFMACFEGYQRYCNQQLLLKDLFGNDEQQNPFTRYEASSQPSLVTADDREKKLENLVRDIFRNVKKWRAVVSACKDDSSRYRIDLSIPRLPVVPDGIKITIHPLCRQSANTDLSEIMSFPDLPLAEVNSLYVIHLIQSANREEETVRNFVIAVPTEGIPDTRDSAIFRRIVTSQNDFFEYISFILGEDYALSLLSQSIAGGSFNFLLGRSSGKPVIYEKMLKAVSRRPEALAEIRDIINLYTGEGDIISPEFIDMYRQFEKMATRRGRKR